MNKALIIIDVQNDYFQGGFYPQFEANAILAPTKKAIQEAKQKGWLVVFVMHESQAGFLIKDSKGAKIHPKLSPYLNDSLIVTKHHADGFLDTNLEAVLQTHNITDLILTGMMTQNCVTHTAISIQAEKYNVSVIANACTAPTQIIHNIALKALADRVRVIDKLKPNLL